jgi:hypothetical protein
MRKWCENSFSSGLSLCFIMMLTLIFLFEGCHSSDRKIQNNKINSSKFQLNQTEDNSAYVRFSSFQNPDSSWGFTIFVNSRPFLLYKKIPYDREKFGFVSKRDAEKVARLFMDMVKAGDSSPKLTKKAIDTLGIVTGNKRDR